MRSIYARYSTEISRRYGRKLGCVWHHFFLVVHLLGGYQEFKRIDWKRVRRLVFVCKGNICRSPYAAAKARAFGIAVSSFGLNSEANMPVNLTAFKVSLQHGLDLSAHLSQSADQFLPSFNDLLIAMEPWQGRKLQYLSHGTGAQVTLLGLWHSQPRPHIEDPCGLHEDYFETCFSIIDDAIKHIANQMKFSYAQ